MEKGAQPYAKTKQENKPCMMYPDAHNWNEFEKGCKSIDSNVKLFAVFLVVLVCFVGCWVSG
jgi:hypothetical protein